MPVNALAGALLLAMIGLSVAHGLWPQVPSDLAGAAAWAAGLLLIGRVRGAQRIQVAAMFGVGLAGLMWGSARGVEAQWDKALSANQALLAMLAAVSFLRLITVPAAERVDHLPLGRKALWRTLFGVHFFGAVINLSAVMILGDRQSARQPLTPLQATVLSRGFSAAANWSPFFAAMGVALTSAPGAALKVLSLVGLPVALLGLSISAWTLGRSGAAAEFRGYPLHYESLWIPALLAVAVLVIHDQLPRIPILTLIALLAVGITALVAVARQGRKGAVVLARYVAHSLPQMANELLLFLAAGVLAAGIATGATAAALHVDLAHFGPGAAGLLLAGMVALAVLGVHPVISISIAGSLLAPVAADPNLLGITFLMTWALGVSTSPFSGMHLAMQGRYGVKAYDFVRWNGRFTLLMLAVDTAALYLYAAWS